MVSHSLLQGIFLNQGSSQGVQMDSSPSEPPGKHNPSPNPSPADLPDPGIKLGSPKWQANTLPPKLPREAKRLFRYELNKIAYDYSVKVTNRFKGLDLIDRVLDNYGWWFITVYGRQ